MSCSRNDTALGPSGTIFRIAIFLFLLSSMTSCLDHVGHDGESASIRKYFYAGGHYVDNGRGEHIRKGHIYVEHLTPVGGARKEYPLLFIHGQALSGTTWLNKPDGKPGWASFFLAQGYELYVVDQTFRGRSPWDPNDGSMSTYSAEYIQKRQTACERYNEWPQAVMHTQWPGNGTMGDEVFDAYYASGVQFLTPGAEEQERSFQLASSALLDRIGRPVIVVAHSQGGILGWLVGDIRPSLVHAIIALEPSGPPFENAVFNTEAARPYGLTNIPMTYDPPVVDPMADLKKKTIISQDPLLSHCTLQDDRSPRRLAKLAEIPVQVITAESSFHAAYDWCTVKFLQQGGVKAEHVLLADYGIHGNGHMMFLEKNSDDIAALMCKVIDDLSGTVNRRVPD